MKQLTAVALLACLVVGLGCAALSEIVTPAEVDKRAVAYATSAGVADVNEFAGYGNLLKARRLATAVESAYQTNTLSLQQLAEKNKLSYDILNGAAQSNVTIAEQREATLFGPTGLLSMGLGLLGFGGLTGMVGLMRKRPGDWTQSDVDAALRDAGVATSNKTRQLTEVVLGIQKVLDAHPKGDPLGDEIRLALSKQSIDTRAAVAVAKVA